MDNYALMLTILQSKRTQGRKPRDKGAGTGNARSGGGMDLLVPLPTARGKPREASSWNFEKFKQLYLKRQRHAEVTCKNVLPLLVLSL